MATDQSVFFPVDYAVLIGMQQTCEVGARNSGKRQGGRQRRYARRRPSTDKIKVQ